MHGYCETVSTFALCSETEVVNLAEAWPCYNLRNEAEKGTQDEKDIPGKGKPCIPWETYFYPY